MTIHRILVDETHLGKIVSNKTQGDGHKNKRPNAKEARKLPKSEWVIVENCHEAVKTPEEHDKIIKMIEERTKIPTRSRKKAHIFTGLIKCGKCGHFHTFYSQGKELMKPCWYADEMGNKCGNKGILVETMEQIVIEEISKYKDRFITDIEQDEDEMLENFYILIEEKQTQLLKYQKALETVNDAYELGDYDRDEWLIRKDRWKRSIEQTKADIYDLKKQSLATKKLSGEERLNNIAKFFDNIKTSTDNAQRNDLYKTIINSIIYTRDGDDISIKIDFK